MECALLKLKFTDIRTHVPARKTQPALVWRFFSSLHTLFLSTDSPPRYTQTQNLLRKDLTHILSKVYSLAYTVKR